MTTEASLYGWITQREAEARGLVADAIPVGSMQGDEPCVLPYWVNEQARVRWREHCALAKTVQPSGWSGGRHPDVSALRRKESS